MKKNILFPFLFLMCSCGHGKNEQNGAKDSSLQQPSENVTTVPGAEKLDFSHNIQLTAGEDMRFNQELFRIKAGEKIRLIFTNVSARSTASMTHNVVILNKGTDIADFAEVARKAQAEQYVPAELAPLIIAHTKMVAGGASDSITFKINSPGVYDYICSYPGHWGTMQGKIVAE